MVVNVFAELVKLKRLANERDNADMNSKSIQNADTADEKGMTQAKKLGVKIHLEVDIFGLPHTIAATTANVTARDSAVEMISFFRSGLTSIVKVLYWL